MNLNRAIIAGRLTKDPELKSLPSGGVLCTFTVATNDSYTKNGSKVESVEYHSVITFGVTAETSAKYLKKGQLVLVEGKIQTRSWEDKDGQKRYKTEVLGQSVQFGPSLGGAQPEKPKESAPVQKVEKHIDKAEIEYPEEDINPDDIPF